MIRRKEEEVVNASEITIIVASPSGSISLKVRCAKADHKIVKKYMIDTMQNNTLFAEEWSRVHKAMLSIFDSNQNKDVICAEIAKTVVTNMFSTEMSKRIYEIVIC